jgi:hypothetical protein
MSVDTKHEFCVLPQNFLNRNLSTYLCLTAELCVARRKICVSCKCSFTFVIYLLCISKNLFERQWWLIDEQGCTAARRGGWGRPIQSCPAAHGADHDQDGCVDVQVGNLEDF